MAKTKPLTNTEVKQSKPKDKVYKLSDGEGLQLRIRPNGTKSWLLDYIKPFTKKRTSISFGMYPEISLSTARDMRREAKEQLAQNIDPKEYKIESQTKQKEILNNTLIKVSENWLEIKRAEVSDDHADDIWRSLELHIFPELEKQSVASLTAPLVIKVIKPIAEKGSLETVKRLCQRLNEIMTFAVNTGVIHSNPLAGIKSAFANPKKKHLPTIKPDELPLFMRELNFASIKKVTRLLIEWQLHTMTRSSEAAGTKWTEIDFDNCIWNIPAERMKAKRPHSIPLTKQSLHILTMIKSISGNREHVFPSDRAPNKHTHESTANMAIKRMGYKGILVAHGLRALASTTLNEQGFDSDIIESALAHVDKNEIRRAYNRAEYLETRRKMMEWWSIHIEESPILLMKK